MPELEPPLLGSCLIHMLRRLPEPLVSCVEGGMQPRGHLISAQVLATEERARLYSMQLMLDLVAEANRGSSNLLLVRGMAFPSALPGELPIPFCLQPQALLHLTPWPILPENMDMPRQS